MIDKIDGRNPYDYPRTTSKKVMGADAYDAAYNIRRDSVIGGKQKENEEEGVILDLSTQKKQTKKEDSFVEENKKEQSTGLTFAQIKKTVVSMIVFIKETWRLIWEDATEDSASGKNMDEENLKSLEDESSEIWADERIEEAEQQKQAQMQTVLKSRNLDSLAAILTENGKKQLAKNSTLLTTYDRKGRIVDVDETEKERILHGDKNFIKL